MGSWNEAVQPDPLSTRFGTREELNFSFTIEPSAPVIFNGQSVFAQGRLNFTAGEQAIASTVVTPFSFSGDLDLLRQQPGPGVNPSTNLFQELALTGGGTMTANFVPGAENFTFLNSLRYDFQPATGNGNGNASPNHQRCCCLGLVFLSSDEQCERNNCDGRR